MERPEQTEPFAIACRYIPYDQWFVTHVHPGWKVKRMKESIVAKALNLQFDRRLLEVDVPIVRPPSPITFAPDESHRPVSPIKFASRNLKKRKSRAGISVDSSVDGSVAGSKDAKEENGALAADETEQADVATAEGTETLVDDEDEDRVDTASIDSGDGYEEDDESDDDIHPLSRARTPTGSGTGRVYVPPVKMPVPSLDASLSRPFPGLGFTAVHVQPPPGAPSGIPGGLISTQTNARPKEQIFTAPFTFIRYSTGQILEDDFNVGWYHFSSNEMLEVHFSSPPRSFLVSAFLGDILQRGGSYVVPGIGTALASGGGGHSSTTGSSGPAAATAMSLSKVGFSMAPGPATSSIGGSAGSSYSSLSTMFSNIVAGEVPGVSLSSTSSTSKSGKTLTVSLSLTPSQFLTALPRNDIQTYIQPYWEGWVRALRVVYRPEVDPLGQYSYGGPHGAGGNPTAFTALGGNQFEGMGGMGTNLGLWAKDPGLHVNDADLRRRQESGRDGGSSSKRKTKMEWRDRWVVIRDGMIIICKDRDDPSPTHQLPLSALTNLRGADHLANNVKNRDRPVGGRNRENEGNGAEKGGSTLQPGAIVRRPSSSHSTTTGTPTATTTFSSNPPVGANTPRRSTSVSANSSSTSRASTRRGTVSGATSLYSPTSTDATALNVLTPGPVASPHTPTPSRPAPFDTDAEISPPVVSTPRPDASIIGLRSALTPLIMPQPSTTNASRIAASAPISPVSVTSPLSPTMSNFHSHTPANITAASSSKANIKSPTSSGASALFAESSSGRREAKSPSSSHRSDRKPRDQSSRHYSSRDPKAHHSRTASLERDQKTQEQREKDRKRRLRERELAKEAAEDLEYIQKWDDFGFGFGKKAKDKDKDKSGKVDKGKDKDRKAIKSALPAQEREREKDKRQQEKNRERDLQKELAFATFGVGVGTSLSDGLMPHGVLPPLPAPSSADSPSHGRSTSRSTIRQKHQISSLHRPRGLHLFDKTYIPSSKDEAEAIGMRIICAKFRVEPIDKTPEQDQKKRFTSTGPSIGAEPTPLTKANDNMEADDEPGFGYLRRRDKDKDKDRKKLEKKGKDKDKSKHERDGYEDKLKKFAPSTSSSHILNLADASISRAFPPRKASLPGLGLGFGKDKEKEKGAERSSDKTQRRKEKDRGKKKDHDDSGEDFPGETASGLSWKLRRRRKQADGSDADIGKSATATEAEDDDDPTDDGNGLPEAATHTTPLVHVQVQVQTKAEGGRAMRPELIAATSEQSCIPDEESDDNVNLSSPVFAHSTDSNDDSEDDFGPDRRRGYRYGGYHEEKLKRQLQQKKEESGKEQEGKSSPKSPLKKRDDDKYEWIVLDMGSIPAYNSILRIFHRHFNGPIQSGFLNNSSSTYARETFGYDYISHSLSQDDCTSDDQNVDRTVSSTSHHPSTLIPNRKRRRATSTLALPYPEWRNQTVKRARSQGMLESGRPAELVMNDWGAVGTEDLDFKKRPLAGRKGKFGANSDEICDGIFDDRKTSSATITAVKGKQKEIDSLSTTSETEDTVFEAAREEDIYPNADPIVLEDSEEESEEEFARWWRDIPRQVSVQKDQGRLQQADERKDRDKGLDSDGDEPPPTGYQVAVPPFSNPFDPTTSSSDRPTIHLASTPPTTESSRQPPPISITTSGLTALEAHYRAAGIMSPTSLTPTPSTLRNIQSPDSLFSATSTQVPLIGSPVLSSPYPDGPSFHPLPPLPALREDTEFISLPNEVFPISRFHYLPPSTSPQEERLRQSEFIKELEPSATITLDFNEQPGVESYSNEATSANAKEMQMQEDHRSRHSSISPVRDRAAYQFPPPSNGSFHNHESSSSTYLHRHQSSVSDDEGAQSALRKVSGSSLASHPQSLAEETELPAVSDDRSQTHSGSLHHSISLPSGSLFADRPLSSISPRRQPSSAIPRRERTITLPTNRSLATMETGLLAPRGGATSNEPQVIRQTDTVEVEEDLQKPILSLEQIQKIENETLDARQPHDSDETMMGLTITPTRQTAPMTFNSSSPPGSVGRTLGKWYTARNVGARRPRVRTGNSGSERESDDERRGKVSDHGAGLEGENPSHGVRLVPIAKSNHTYPNTTPAPPGVSSSRPPSMSSSPTTHSSLPSSSTFNEMNSTSGSTLAKDILHRVRSGSSLHLMPMGVHVELEENTDMERAANTEIAGSFQKDDIYESMEDFQERGRNENPSGFDNGRGGSPSHVDGERGRKSAMFTVGGYSFASVNGHGIGR